jgi:hypothetical protein
MTPGNLPRREPQSKVPTPAGSSSGGYEGEIPSNVGSGGGFCIQEIA